MSYLLLVVAPGSTVHPVCILHQIGPQCYCTQLGKIPLLAIARVQLMPPRTYAISSATHFFLIHCSHTCHRFIYNHRLHFDSLASVDLGLCLGSLYADTFRQSTFCQGQLQCLCRSSFSLMFLTGPVFVFSYSWCFLPPCFCDKLCNVIAFTAMNLVKHHASITPLHY